MDSIEYHNKLTDIRLTRGDDSLLQYFIDLLNKDKNKAIDLLNYDNLDFTSLYVLKDKIEELDIKENLSDRNKLVIDIINEVEENQTRSALVSTNITALNYIQSVYFTLKWILETATLEKMMDDVYTEIVDCAAVFLIKVYKDNESLAQISDWIFKRKITGCGTHQLVWSFFEGKDINSLYFIIEKLKSQNRLESKFSCKLLKFIPNIDYVDPGLRYDYAVKWLENNKKFLYFTGESQQEKMNPIYCKVNKSAKYLQKKINSSNGEIKEELTENEKAKLNTFNMLSKDTQEGLSEYSNWLFNRSINWWKIWITYDLNRQIEISRKVEVE